MANFKNWESEADSIKVTTLSLLKWDELKWCEFMEKTGRQFLQVYISTDPDGIDFLIGDITFWRWWRMNWFYRDRCFSLAAVILASHERENYYANTLHSIDNIIQDITSGTYVLGANYAKSIKQIAYPKKVANE